MWTSSLNCRRPTRVATALGVMVLAGTIVSGADQNPNSPQGEQHGPGHGAGMAGNARAQADMELFHFLLDNRDQIRRTVTSRPDGVETLTESDNPEVVGTLQVHVASMAARLRDADPIHMRDPLFREVFSHAKQITMDIIPTPHGVRVVETSADPYVVKLIQAHAAVISLFAKNGRAEAMKDHDVPARD